MSDDARNAWASIVHALACQKCVESTLQKKRLLSQKRWVIAVRRSV
jgi:hypothetical protein